MTNFRRGGSIKISLLLLFLCALITACGGSPIAEDDFFDPSDGSFDDWLGSDDLIDWDADGEFDEQDYELLQWFYDESTEDVDGDALAGLGNDENLTFSLVYF